MKDLLRYRVGIFLKTGELIGLGRTKGSGRFYIVRGDEWQGSRMFISGNLAKTLVLRTFEEFFNEPVKVKNLLTDP